MIDKPPPYTRQLARLLVEGLEYIERTALGELSEPAWRYLVDVAHLARVQDRTAPLHWIPTAASMAWARKRAGPGRARSDPALVGQQHRRQRRIARRKFNRRQLQESA